MGSGRWDPRAYTAYSSTVSNKTVDETFTARTIKSDLDPKGIAVRESRDSIDNPASTALIVAIDVTGSMGMIADTLAKQGLGTLFEEVLSRKPISDPHLMFMALGDAAYDRSPLQVSQFEADSRIIEQLSSIYLEHGGGGNDTESYNLPWYFAAMHTSIDCYEKRGKKGYLFTVGDEQAPNPLTKDQLHRILGDTIETDTFSNDELLAIVRRSYHVFHVVVAEGQYAKGNPEGVRSSWAKVLGQHVLWLDDHKKLSEVIVSTIEITEGRDKAAVAASWNGDTSLVVANATKHLTAATSAPTGLIAP